MVHFAGTYLKRWFSLPILVTKPVHTLSIHASSHAIIGRQCYTKISVRYVGAGLDFNIFDLQEVKRFITAQLSSHTTWVAEVLKVFFYSTVANPTLVGPPHRFLAFADEILVSFVASAAVPVPLVRATLAARRAQEAIGNSSIVAPCPALRELLDGFCQDEEIHIKNINEFSAALNILGCSLFMVSSCSPIKYLKITPISSVFFSFPPSFNYE